MKSKNSKFKVQNSTFSAQGYTLIEVLVAVTIFVILVAGPTGFFISALRAQTRALAQREIVDNTSYTVEYMSRALRMALKDLTAGCISYGKNYDNPGGDDSIIRFLNYQGLCTEFSLDNGRLQQRKSTDWTSGNFEPALYLTSDDLEITQVNFRLFGENQGDDFQPRVTMVLKIKKRGVSDSPETRIQTTVSQRNLDVRY